MNGWKDEFRVTKGAARWTANFTTPSAAYGNALNHTDSSGNVNPVVLSDRILKDNFTTLNPQEILAKVGQLEITQWNYKSDDPSVRHIGPMAQDFYTQFGLGDSERYISLVDTAGVSILAIQALNQNLASLASSTASATSMLESSILTFTDTVSSTFAQLNNQLTLLEQSASSTSITLANLTNSAAFLQSQIDSLRVVVSTTVETIALGGPSLQMATATSMGLLLQGNGNNNLNAENLAVAQGAVFEGRVTVKKRVAFGADTVGQAEILQGHTSTTVRFSEPYEFAPVITVTPVGYEGIWKLAEVTTSSFKITLVNNLSIFPSSSLPVLFNWHAFASDGGKIFVSDGTMREVNIRVEIPNDQIPMTNQIPNPNAELRGNDVALRNDQISTTTVESSTTSVSVVAPTSTEEAIGDGAIDGDNNSGFGATSTPNTPSPDEQSAPAPVIDSLPPSPVSPTA